MSIGLSGACVRRSPLLVACVVGLGLIWPQLAAATPASPFARLAGEWRGVGTATGADGHSERITCRADNRVSEDESNLSQSLVCASDSYRFDIRTDISTDGRAVRGRWEESTRNASGGLSGEVEGNSIRGTVEAPTSWPTSRSRPGATSSG